jgi:hypothetical protein
VAILIQDPDVSIGQVAIGVRIRTGESGDPESWIIGYMSLDVLLKEACKSLRTLIFDANLPPFTVEHGVCLSGMYYWPRSARRLIVRVFRKRRRS